MIVILCFTAFVTCACGQGFAPWRRLSKTELYFYNGIDGKPEIGWNDKDSVGVHVTHNVALTSNEGGPAEGLAKLDFTALIGDWLIKAANDGYKATQKDEIILRIRAENNDTILIFHGGEVDSVDAITSSIPVPPGWRQIHIPLTKLLNPIDLKTVGLRKERGSKGNVYVAYMYLKVSE